VLEGSAATALDFARRGPRTWAVALIAESEARRRCAREANDRGYECLLIEDATESYFPAFKQATLEMVRAQGGIVGWTAPWAALRASL
jgi:nicotinamidase-related amidase